MLAQLIKSYYSGSFIYIQQEAKGTFRQYSLHMGDANGVFDKTTVPMLYSHEKLITREF